MKEIRFLCFSLMLCSHCYGLSNSYKLSSTYDATNFFTNFNFETISDPTHGAVNYIDYATASSLGLANYTKNKIYMGVDYKTVITSGGRKSLRLSSKRVLKGNNLIIIDLDHMPTTVGNVLPKGCSIWPAFWTVGPEWPNNGEIDIIEYVNTDSMVSTSLHTSDGCDQSSVSSSTLTGTWGTTNGNPNDNCYINAAGQSSNSGCGFHGAASTVGAEFNTKSGGGGVYVLEWATSQQIRSFYFPRASIPQDIIAKQPDPSSWGLPYARFEIGACGSQCASSHFDNHQIIFDTTFCGDWAGNSYVFSAACSSTISCTNFVYNNPAEFAEAYWLINYLDIYDIATPSLAPVSAAPTTPLVPFFYQLSSTYDSTNFFTNFNFETFGDPTNGVVQYVDYPTATNLGLVKYQNNKVYMGVDYTNVLTSGGRKSVRLTSKRVLNGNNLIIIDLDHMPTTVGNVLPKGCSIWPAFWTFGPNWPNSGEIDIVEYVNTDSTVATSLHTSYGCKQSSNADVSLNKFTGTWGTSYGNQNTNCYVYAGGQSSNSGCGIHGAANTVGSTFNTQSGGGGVFVLEWDKRQQIRSFYFPRASIPQDIIDKKPDPSSWGLPYARFEIGAPCASDCPNTHFANHNVIFDTTFCGDWAGNSYVFSAACSSAISCTNFVYNNPAEFAETYWLINYLDVYDVFEPTAAPVFAPTFTPTVTPSYAYLGCYGDNGNARALLVNLGTVSSIASCANKAVAGHYQYFGLQYGGECRASNDFISATKYGICGPACTGATPYCVCTKKCSNGIDDCGGGNSNALYQIGTVSATPTLTPVTATTASSLNPSFIPTISPTKFPTKLPASSPISSPTQIPTKLPTLIPTSVPVVLPISSPTISPTKLSTFIPTYTPTKVPINTSVPSTLPVTTSIPTSAPSKIPSRIPTTLPTRSPTTQQPIASTNSIPTNIPTVFTSLTTTPSANPTEESSLNRSPAINQSPTIIPATYIPSSNLSPINNYTTTIQPISAINQNNKSTTSLSTAVMFGSVIVIVFIIALCFLLFILYQRQRKANKENTNHDLERFYEEGSGTDTGATAGAGGYEDIYKHNKSRKSNRGDTGVGGGSSSSSSSTSGQIVGFSLKGLRGRLSTIRDVEQARKSTATILQQSEHYDDDDIADNDDNDNSEIDASVDSNNSNHNNNDEAARFSGSDDHSMNMPLTGRMPISTKFLQTQQELDNAGLLTRLSSKIKATFHNSNNNNNN